MCISVIYGPINQPARHRGNNSAAGKKERALAKIGTRGWGWRGVFFSWGRNFIHARAFVSRVPRPHSEGAMYDKRMYVLWLLLLHFAQTSVRDVGITIAIHIFHFSVVEMSKSVICFFSRHISAFITYSYTCRENYLNSNYDLPSPFDKSLIFCWDWFFLSFPKYYK